jgi:hypothetical protein
LNDHNTLPILKAKPVMQQLRSNTSPLCAYEHPGTHPV